MNQADNWLNIIQNYALRANCILCAQTSNTGRDLCAYCYQHLPRNAKPCWQCAAANTAPRCQQCARQPPVFDSVIAPFLYQDAFVPLITALKFQGDYKNARLLAALLMENLTPLHLPECIIPVPLHPKRYRERGFNQSLEIARHLRRELKIPLDVSSCIRQRNTPQQALLTAPQRRQSIKNAFAVVKKLNVRHVALLDDVMTTGSTVAELTRVLKQAGVARVDIWACARASH